MLSIKQMIEYTKDLKILYVEDDIELVKSTHDLFLNYFSVVDVAYNGSEGLEKFNEYYKEYNYYYDLVITDINMPNIDGITMSSEIFKIYPEQPIVIISAYSDADHLFSAIDIGINAFLKKPIDNEQLKKVIYKVSRAISDRKFVNVHVDQLETLNMKLEDQNAELVAKNLELEKSTRVLNTIVHKPAPVSVKIVEEKASVDEIEEKFIHEQIQELIHEDLFELKEIHTEIDVFIIEIVTDVGTINEDTLQTLSKLFSKYASIVSLYSFFDELAAAMANFSRTLHDNPLPENSVTVENIFMLVESFMYVLGKWQDDLSSGDKNKINSLDASIISDMHTITNMWTAVEEEVCEEALDDIFDF